MRMKITKHRNQFANAINFFGFGNVRTLYSCRLFLVCLVIWLPLHLFSQEQPSLSNRIVALQHSKEFCDYLSQIASGNTNSMACLNILLEFNQNQAYDDICGSNKEISFLSLLNSLAKANGKYRIECQQTARKEELSWFESAWPNGSTNTDPAYVIVVPINKKVNGRQTEGLLLVRAVSGKIVNYYKTVPPKFYVQSFGDTPQPAPSVVQTFTDERDGHAYRTVTINNQVWMAENLAYKPTSGTHWNYNDYKDFVSYGYLYDWKTAREACPTGWHLPSNDDWETLINYVGSEAGKNLKSTTGWREYGDNNNATDIYGFSALPGGWDMEKYISLHESGYWWTSSKTESGAWGRSMQYNDDRVAKEHYSQNQGFSVRCLKDK